MKAIILCAALVSAALLGGATADPVFVTSEIRSKESLKLKILASSEYSPRLAPGRKLKRIDLEFTSFEWAGETWRHSATVLLPDRVEPSYRGAGAIVSGNGGFDKSALTVRLAEEAALLGVPVLAITGDNPGAHYGVVPEGQVMLKMDAMYTSTGDPNWIGYAVLGKVIMRGATALQSLPGVDAQRFVVTGGSKRGIASWIAAGVDDRVVGAFPTSWDSGNLEQVLELKSARWGADRRGTVANLGSISPREQLAKLRTPRGQAYQKYVDPFLWKERFANKQVLFSVGTNDQYFHPMADSLFLPQMPPSVRILLVPNHGHEAEKENQFLAWRMWLAHTFAGRAIPSIKVSSTRKQGLLEVSASVKSTTTIQAVKLWSASDERGAYMGTQWSSTDLVLRNGAYRGEIPAPADRFTAYFVEVQDTDAQAKPGFVSSGMQEVKP